MKLKNLKTVKEHIIKPGKKIFFISFDMFLTQF
jgi:hypothetical protein